MSLSTIYSKTGKGAQVLTGKDKALPADSMRVLSLINGESNARTILMELEKLTEDEFTRILERLLESGHIRVVADEALQAFFIEAGATGSIDVMEISAEEFIKTEANAHGLNSDTQIRQQKEAEARARLHAEQQLKLEADTKAQAESERDLLKITDMMVNSIYPDLGSIETAVNTAKAERVGADQVEAASALEKQALIVAQRKAEAQARLDADKSARIAAEREVAENARRDDEAIAKREADEKIRIATERKAKEEAQRLARKQVAAETKARLKAETKRKAEARAFIKAEEKAYKKAGRGLGMDIGKWLRAAAMLVRRLLITASVTTLVLLLLLQLVNLGMLVSPLAGPVEKMLSESIKEPVTIRKVYASLWPKPHLVLDGITIGGSADINIETVRVLPTLSTLFNESIALQYIKVSGLVLNKDDAHRPLQWLAASANHGQLKFNQILLERTSFVLPDLVLPPLDGELTFTPKGGFSGATIHTGNRNAIVHISPLNGALAIDLTAQEWSLPLGAPLVFEELHASGLVENNRLELSQIKGRLYGGNIKALMSLDWAADWNAKGNFKLSEVELKELMTGFSSAISLEGPVTASASFVAQAEELSSLFSRPEISANFSVDDGAIKGIDLGRAMKGDDRNDIAGSTRFNAFSGRLTARDGNYKYRDLVLEAGQLRATAELDILDNQDITGAVQTSLMTQSRKMQSSFVLSGNTSNLALK